MKEDKSNINSLIDKLLNDEDYNERMEAAFDLGNLKDKKAISALLEALNDENPQVKKFAAISLGKFRDPSALDSLLKLTNSKNVQERYGAVVGLSEYEDEKIAERFIELLNEAESDNDIQIAILDSLKSYKDPNFVNQLINFWPNARRGAIKSKIIDIFDEWYDLLTPDQVEEIKTLLDQILDDRIRDLSSNRVIGHHYESGLEITASELAYTIILKNKKFVSEKHLKLIESLCERDDITKEIAQELLEELNN